MLISSHRGTRNLFIPRHEQGGSRPLSIAPTRHPADVDIWEDDPRTFAEFHQCPDGGVQFIVLAGDGSVFIGSPAYWGR
jgi:hypothetical protein